MLVRSLPNELPDTGAVGGIDVGWSEVRATSAVARLAWDRSSVSIEVERFRATADERTRAIGRILPGKVLAAAIDGPLCTGLQLGRNYRFAERALTLGFQPRIGKPGQLSSPNGQKLNWQATECARMLALSGLVATASHDEKVHTLAIVEAFPTSFLGVMLAQPDGLKTKKRASSDVFYEVLANSGTLRRLVQTALPGRVLSFDPDTIRNHDDRAAFVCALTALSLASGRYTAVGDLDGWIILPPFEFVEQWAKDLFVENGERLERDGIRPVFGRKLGLFAEVSPSVEVEP